MGKGSQLTQLKSAITQAGLNGRPAPSKKRKRTNASKTNQVDKDKKAAKLKEIHQKLNPFDIKVTKLKHDVGGRKIKGVVGKPAQSRQVGIEERKRTLLKEYETKNHAGGIVDRRFGENDPSMPLEERMLERFTKERQRASRGDLFNLEDDDDIQLTHYGQSLSKLDDFEGTGLGLDEEDEEETRGQIDGDIVKAAHFGGFEVDEEEEGEDGEPPRKKSKAEVMAEVIAKSKDHKFRRQTEKGEDESLRAQLDNEFDSLRSLLYSVPTTNTESQAEERPASDLLGTSKRDTEYDALIRSLAFEARAKPKDRTKTEEELARDEKERLEARERKRLRRMQGLESEEEEGDGKRRGGGDDLEDDFFDEKGMDWTGLGEGLREEEKSKVVDQEESGSDEEEDVSEEGSEEEEEGEDEDEGEWVSDEDGDEGEQEALVALQKKSSKSKGKSKATDKELPYTFPAPESHEDFLDIVEDIADEDVPTVVQRIRTLYHPSLAEDNKLKLKALTNVLIDHILYITSPPVPHFSLLNALVPHLATLTEKYSIPSATHFRSKLTLMHKNLKRGLTAGALDPASKTWPGLPELSLLRVLGAVWSTSDMKHSVVTPARLLMSAYLALARVRSLADIASGLFLCTLFLQYEERSKRFVPEAVNFVVNAVLHLAPHKYKEVKDVPGWFPCPDFKSELCGPLAINHKQVKKLGLEARKPDLGRLLSGGELGEQQKVDMLGLTLDLLSRFAEMYKGLDGFIELYEPILQVLQHVELQRLPQTLEDRVEKVIDMFTRLLKFARQSRRPLQLQVHKPIPIASYVPKWDSSTSNYLKHSEPDQERKLRRQYKQEKKGALRELRKDARFLAEVQQKEVMQKDKKYGERMKRVFGSIESERAEQKAMEREKVREKKRAGRR